MRFACAVAALALASAGFADTLTLKSGRVVNGTYLGGTARTIKMEVGDAIQSFDVGDVSTLQFASASPAAPSSAQEPAQAPAKAPAPAAAPVTAAAPRVMAPTSAPAPDAAPATARAGTELPAGTNIVIRMIDAVDSETASVGQTFNASLDEPVMINGETVVPRGADATVKLVQDQQSGKLTGQTVLVLDLVSVKVNGRMVDMNTQTVSQASASRGNRTAKVATGGAALGAIIGAIAGGGKGAAVGAVAGAGAGAATQVITKGQTVKIPSETRLTFTLDTPVKI